MKRSSAYDSIKSRERNMFGTFSFVSPLVPSQVKQSVRARDSAPEKKKEHTLGAQRNHRKRTKDYMNALEQEVLRLREEHDGLTQQAADWEKIALALIRPVNMRQNANGQQLAQLPPGVFFWPVPPGPGHESAYEVPNMRSWPSWRLLDPTQPLRLDVSRLDASNLTVCTRLASPLFQNFCENIVPTLNVDGTSGDGYFEHYLPLALTNDMVMGALLAASASHVQLSRGKDTSLHRLRCRSAALTRLQNASDTTHADPVISLAALATILGLLIDDMIAYSKDFSTLLDLARFWMSKDYIYYRGEGERMAHGFLSHQIRMLQVLVYPLYLFDMQTLNTPNLIDRGADTRRLQVSLFRDPAKLHDAFRSLESATSQACQLLKLVVDRTGARSRSGGEHFPFSSFGAPASSRGAESDTDGTQAIMDSRPSVPVQAKVDHLLDNLQCTIRNKILPFTPGEASLVWVCYVAAAKSAQARHRTFFVSRLAEVLRRIGHDDISTILGRLYSL